jgi:hypothetical protein
VNCEGFKGQQTLGKQRLLVKVDADGKICEGLLFLPNSGVFAFDSEYPPLPHAFDKKLELCKSMNLGFTF